MPPDSPPPPPPLPDLPTSSDWSGIRDALILLLAAVQWLVAREEARNQDRGYLRTLAESPISLPPRLDQVAALVAIAAIAGALGVSGSQVWGLVAGTGP